MVSSLLMVAAMCAVMMWYAGRTDWRVLFSGLDAKDTQQVAQELTAAGIPYQMTEDGSGIEVGADQVDKARMEVATKGMPQSGRMGFELFDKPNWVGSEFDEKVNYQRAMEGELEHTIGTIAAVRSARVHLVLPKDSLFGDEAKSAKASVVLQLKRSTMPPEQVEAIRGLVAGAVENLSPEDVTLVDADGRLNLNARGPGAVADDAERGLEDKLVAMLEPTAGSGNVRATVNVSYDESSEEKTDDVYDPAQVATLTMHKSEQTVGQKTRVSGVPGTASNTPAAAAVGSVGECGGRGGPTVDANGEFCDGGNGWSDAERSGAGGLSAERIAGWRGDGDGRERELCGVASSVAHGAGAGTDTARDSCGGGERSHVERGDGQAGARGMEAAQCGRDAAVGTTGESGGWIRRHEGGPGGD
jgi:flagellar M-ring protein FliF